MEIPDESPRKQPEKDGRAKSKKEATPSPLPKELSPEIESSARIVATASANLVHSRSKLNMLSFLLYQCREGELIRSPEDSIGRQAAPKNRAEKFLLDRSESPLQEAEEAKRYFSMLDNPIQKIDESDKTAKTLGEYLKDSSPEKFAEMQQATEQLLKEDTIQERVQEILLQSSPELLQDYKEYHEIIGGISMEQNLSLIIGKDPDPKTKKEFTQILKDEEKECNSWSMLEAEKARILCNALTLPKDSEKKPQLLKEARRLLGEDTVNLIEAQVNHTNNTILRLYASESEPSNTPEELLCPAILERMGEEGPNKQQLKSLAEVQEFYLHRRGDTPPTGEELSHQTARATLASLYVLEYGTWINQTNVLKEFHEIKQSKKKEFGKFAETHREKDPANSQENQPSQENPIPDPKKAKANFEKKMEKIGMITSAYNEGVTNDEYRANKEQILRNLRKESGERNEGLLAMENHDIQKCGAPKQLATQISNFLGTEKNKQRKVKELVKNQMTNHIVRLQQNIFNKTWQGLKEEFLHEQGKNFGENEGLYRSMKEMGMQTMDQIS